MNARFRNRIIAIIMTLIIVLPSTICNIGLQAIESAWQVSFNEVSVITESESSFSQEVTLTAQNIGNSWDSIFAEGIGLSYDSDVFDKVSLTVNSITYNADNTKYTVEKGDIAFTVADNQVSFANYNELVSSLSNIAVVNDSSGSENTPAASGNATVSEEVCGSDNAASESNGNSSASGADTNASSEADNSEGTSTSNDDIDNINVSAGGGNEGNSSVSSDEAITSSDDIVFSDAASADSDDAVFVYNTSTGSNDAVSDDNTSAGSDDVISSDNTSAGSDDVISGDNTSAGSDNVVSSDDVSAGSDDVITGDNASNSNVVTTAPAYIAADSVTITATLSAYVNEGAVSEVPYQITLGESTLTVGVWDNDISGMLMQSRNLDISSAQNLLDSLADAQYVNLNGSDNFKIKSTKTATIDDDGYLTLEYAWSLDEYNTSGQYYTFNMGFVDQDGTPLIKDTEISVPIKVNGAEVGTLYIFIDSAGNATAIVVFNAASTGNSLGSSGQTVTDGTLSMKFYVGKEASSVTVSVNVGGVDVLEDTIENSMPMAVQKSGVLTKTDLGYVIEWTAYVNIYKYNYDSIEITDYVGSNWSIKSFKVYTVETVTETDGVITGSTGDFDITANVSTSNDGETITITPADSIYKIVWTTEVLDNTAVVTGQEFENFTSAEGKTSTKSYSEYDYALVTPTIVDLAKNASTIDDNSITSTISWTVTYNSKGALIETDKVTIVDTPDFRWKNDDGRIVDSMIYGSDWVYEDIKVTLEDTDTSVSTTLTEGDDYTVDIDNDGVLTITLIASDDTNSSTLADYIDKKLVITYDTIITKKSDYAGYSYANSVKDDYTHIKYVGTTKQGSVVKTAGTTDYNKLEQKWTITVNSDVYYEVDLDYNTTGYYIEDKFGDTGELALVDGVDGFLIYNKSKSNAAVKVYNAYDDGAGNITPAETISNTEGYFLYVKTTDGFRLYFVAGTSNSGTDMYTITYTTSFVFDSDSGNLTSNLALTNSVTVVGADVSDSASKTIDNTKWPNAGKKTGTLKVSEANANDNSQYYYIEWVIEGNYWMNDLTGATLTDWIDIKGLTVENGGISVTLYYASYVKDGTVQWNSADVIDENYYSVTTADWTNNNGEVIGTKIETHFENLPEDKTNSRFVAVIKTKLPDETEKKQTYNNKAELQRYDKDAPDYQSWEYSVDFTVSKEESTTKESKVEDGSRATYTIWINKDLWSLTNVVITDLFPTIPVTDGNGTDYQRLLYLDYTSVKIYEYTTEIDADSNPVFEFDEDNIDADRRMKQINSDYYDIEPILDDPDTTEFEDGFKIVFKNYTVNTALVLVYSCDYELPKDKNSSDMVNDVNITASGSYTSEAESSIKENAYAMYGYSPTYAVSLLKVDENGIGLEGAKFELVYYKTKLGVEYPDGGVAKTATTDTSGTYHFKGLNQGTYRLYEVMPPSGYYISYDMEYIEFELSSDGTWISSLVTLSDKASESAYVGKEGDNTIVVTNNQTQLTIKKTVSGSNTTRQFKFTVQIQGGGTFTLKYSNGTETTFSNGDIYLANGESATITGIPVGATYEVTEEEVNGYKVSYKVNNDPSVAASSVSATLSDETAIEFTNEYISPGEETTNTPTTTPSTTATTTPSTTASTTPSTTASTTPSTTATTTPSTTATTTSATTATTTSATTATTPPSTTATTTPSTTDLTTSATTASTTPSASTSTTLSTTATTTPSTTAATTPSSTVTTPEITPSSLTEPAPSGAPSSEPSQEPEPSAQVTLDQEPIPLDNGYTAISLGDNEYLILDSGGTPLGTIKLPEGTAITEIDIDEWLPLGTPVLTNNPKTGDNIVAKAGLLIVTAGALVIILCNKKKNLV